MSGLEHNSPCHNYGKSGLDEPARGGKASGRLASEADAEVTTASKAAPI